MFTFTARLSRHKNSFFPVILSSTIISLLSLPNPALADAHLGADATLHACVYLNTRPASPTIYTFNTQALQCMEHIGDKQVSMTVKDAGVSCISLGYVQQKGYTTGGDNCYGLNSGQMLLTYSGGPQGSASGSVQTNWWTYLLYNNHMRLEQASNPSSTNVCFSANKCLQTSVSWPWAGEPTKDLYVIFQPEATSLTHQKPNSTGSPTNK